MNVLYSRLVHVLPVLLAIPLVSCASPASPAGSDTGLIIGSVVDEAGGPVRGVKIRIANSSLITDIVSDSAGSFVIREVTVGSYDLSIYTPANYTLAVGQQNPVPIVLSDGQTLRPRVNVRNSPGTPAVPTVAYVKILNFVYNPEVTRINVGGTVTWQNVESDPHTVRSELGSELNSGNLTRQQRYVHTFNTPGVYPYRCTFHEVMTGTVIVE